MNSSKPNNEKIIEELLKLKLEKQTDDVKLRIQKLQQRLTK
jgi:hypothetical protein|tara:strand:+ start:102 stop:224 length:123 start_codon:yes stop_codon:yes gene_type:complete